ncbi:MAG: hypothetical protein NTY46_13670 [Candidatus Sumerlaeota bacterium]|nr:hypothetical protein [Candidatus Sumerlaeota bacterium]
MNEATSFQCHAPWNPKWDVRSDVAIVYGVDRALASRISEWKIRGYVTHMMTGAAWGGHALKGEDPA